jgi:hypothetical protein
MSVTGTFHRGGLGEKQVEGKGNILKKDNVVNDNTRDKMSEAQKRTTDKGG